jgi:putative ABC transport system substrate-binding protein
VAAACLAVALAVQAQPAAKVHRVGWLSHGSAPAATGGNPTDFEQGLSDLGYVGGKNVVVESRYAGGDVDRLPALAAELSRLNVQVIVASGEPAALAAKVATGAIPIVAIEFGLAPVKAGLVASLARPAGNVTGSATISEELWQKRLALLREIVPRLARLAVLRNPRNPGNDTCVAEIQGAAGGMGVQVRDFRVANRAELALALETIGRESFDAVATCWDSVTLEHAKAIAEFALKRRLATVAPLKEYVQAGALLSFGTNLPAHRRRAAYYVDKILKGAKPAELAMEQPTTFELAVSLTTAEALGLQLPPALVMLADALCKREQCND